MWVAVTHLCIKRERGTQGCHRANRVQELAWKASHIESITTVYSPPQCVRVKRQFLVPGCELIWKQHECNEISQNEAILE